MIVHDFKVMRTIVFPKKTDPPLVVDPDTYCPALSPDKFSNLFPGLAARPPNFTAVSNITSGNSGRKLA
jgi:hypothetical protein